MSFFDLNKKSIQWATLFFLAFIWGSSFILMKRGLEVYNYNEVAALRIGIAFIFLLPFAIKPIKKIEKKYWKYLLMVGFFGNLIPAFLFTKAQTELSSSLAGMLNSLTPIFTLILALLFFKNKIKTPKIIGVVIGLVGTVGLIISSGVSFEKSANVYILYVILATVCYAISVNVIKNHLKEIDAIVITALAFLCIGPWAIAYLFSTHFISTTLNHPQAFYSLLYISVLAIFGTALAVILFNMLIKKTTTLFATSVTYLIPIVAIFWGLFDGETILFTQIISVGIILFGIYFINKIL